jgi:hypothetical protein
MKYILIIILFSFKVNAQDFSTEINQATTEYGKLFIEKNFSVLSEYASPKLVEYLKSKEDFTYLLTELTKNAESKGAKVTNINFGKSSEIVNYKEQLQCAVPFTLELEDEKRKVIFESGLALISFDKGKNWYFTFKVEKEQKLNNEVLDLDAKILIPEKTQKIVNK